MTGYTLYMSVDNGDFVEIAQTPSTSFKVKKMKTGAKHVFKVIAHNSVGKSKALESDTIIPMAMKSELRCEKFSSSFILINLS